MLPQVGAVGDTILTLLLGRKGKKMSNNNSNRSVLHVCMGKNQKLASLVEYAADSIVSKTILDKPVGLDRFKEERQNI